MGTFELDHLARPRAMVVRIHEGPPHHKGQSALCIYELEGDTLRICYTASGFQRPTDFSSKAGDGRTFSEWVRG